LSELNELPRFHRLTLATLDEPASKPHRSLRPVSLRTTHQGKPLLVISWNRHCLSPFSNNYPVSQSLSLLMISKTKSLGFIQSKRKTRLSGSHWTIIRNDGMLRLVNIGKLCASRWQLHLPSVTDLAQHA